MGQEMENLDALPGAVGANGKAGSFTNPEHRLRAERATSLCMMIGDTHPDDAAFAAEHRRHRVVIRIVSAEEIDAGVL